MDDEQDWRLRVDLADAPGVHLRLRGAGRLEHELEPDVAGDVVLSHDDDTLFAYASTRPQIDAARAAIERQIAKDGLASVMRLDRWDDAAGDHGEWCPVDPPPSAAEREHEHEADAQAAEDGARIVTRTFVETSGKLVRNYFENVVANDAKARGVELSIVEHPHLLSTQIAFTLTGPRDAVDQIIERVTAQAAQVTRLGAAWLAPI